MWHAATLKMAGRIVLAKLTRQFKTDAAGPARNQDAIAGHVHGRLVAARY